MPLRDDVAWCRICRIDGWPRLPFPTTDDLVCRYMYVCMYVCVAPLIVRCWCMTCWAQRWHHREALTLAAAAAETFSLHYGVVFSVVGVACGPAYDAVGGVSVSVHAS